MNITTQPCTVDSDTTGSNFAHGAIAGIYGTSEETKPTEYAGGSWFFETDTQDVYMYDEKSLSWKILE